MIERLIAHYHLKKAQDLLGNGMCTLTMVAASQEVLSEEEEYHLLDLWIETCTNVISSVNSGAELLKRMRELRASTVSDAPNHD